MMADEPMSEEQLAEIRACVEASTPGPWVIERSVSQAHNAQEVHWSVRTRDTLPEHPWSPRYILWMTGLLWEARGSHEPHMRWCAACRHMHYDFREVPIDVRSDPEIEADAAFIAHVRTYVPALLAEIDRQRAREAAMLSIVAAVAGMRVEDGIFDQPYYALMHPDHERDADWHRQLVTKARALLGMTEGA